MTITWHESIIHGPAGEEYPAYMAYRGDERLATVSQEQVGKKLWVICARGGERLDAARTSKAAKQLTARLFELPPDEGPYHWTTTDARTIACNHEEVGCVGLIRNVGKGKWGAFDDQNQGLGTRRGKRLSAALVVKHAAVVTVPEKLRDQENEREATVPRAKQKTNPKPGEDERDQKPERLSLRLRCELTREERVQAQTELELGTDAAAANDAAEDEKG